jgi:hypothetical protein
VGERDEVIAALGGAVLFLCGAACGFIVAVLMLI